MSSYSIADHIANFFLEVGIQRAFCVGGGAILPLHKACGQRLRITNADHEASAVFMADGWARCSHGPSAVLVTSGPGALNAVTPVACALSDSIPLVLVSGQPATTDLGRNAFQEASRYGMDVIQIFSEVTKLSVELTAKDDVEAVMRLAITTALTPPRGPVHISLPIDVAGAEFHLATSERTKSPGADPEGKGEDKEDEIHEPHLTEALRTLQGSQRTAFLLGAGIKAAESEKITTALVELTGGIGFVTPKGIGSLRSDHPRYGGVFGFPGNEESIRRLLEEKFDTLVIIGTKLGEWSTHFWDERLWKGRRTIQLDVVKREIRGLFSPDIWIPGDIQQSAQQLAERLKKNSQEKSQAVCSRNSRIPIPPPPFSKSELVHPIDVIRILNQELTDDAQVFLDIGNSMLWGIPYLEINGRKDVHVNLGFGCMGHAVAAVVGAAAAAPTRMTIALVGDGAFLMQEAAVHTAVRYGIKAVWIVLNDGGYRMLGQVEEGMYGHAVTDPFFPQPVDCNALARSMGAQSATAVSAESFRAALLKACNSTKPFVIDARVDPTAVPPALHQRASHLASSL